MFLLSSHPSIIVQQFSKPVQPAYLLSLVLHFHHSKCAHLNAPSPCFRPSSTRDVRTPEPSKRKSKREKTPMPCQVILRLRAVTCRSSLSLKFMKRDESRRHKVITKIRESLDFRKPCLGIRVYPIFDSRCNTVKTPTWC